MELYAATRDQEFFIGFEGPHDRPALDRAVWEAICEYAQRLLAEMPDAITWKLTAPGEGVLARGSFRIVVRT